MSDIETSRPVRPFDPADWYWLAADGRVFSSARLMTIDGGDEAFLAFLASGGFATQWPCDDEGEQTETAIRQVLAPFGIWVDLVAYAADRRWRKEVGGIDADGVPVATDDRSKLMITGARIAAMADAGWSTIWHGANGETYPIGAAAMIAISDAVQAHVNAGFQTFVTVKAAIEAGTMTTTAEIDAAFA